MKVLVARTDRLGDLVLSLPALSMIKAARPDWEVHAMVAPGSLPVVEHHPGLDGVWTWEAGGEQCDSRALIHDLGGAGFDAAVLLQYRRELAMLLRRAGVPCLYGPRSKPTSWFLLNKGTWQRRSRGKRHESEHNAGLVRGLPGMADQPTPLPRVYVSADQRAAGEAFRADSAAGAETVAFVHPGSGGSALDWQPAGFAGVANTLAARPGWRVFVTGAGRDAPQVEAVAGLLDPGVDVLLDAFTLREFLGVLSAGDVFVGPSTGPLHLAAALDLAAVGLYPPVATMAPERWGPRGRWVTTMVPKVDCPAVRTCRGERCALYNCMDGIATTEVVEAAMTVATRRHDERATPQRIREEPA